MRTIFALALTCALSAACLPAQGAPPPGKASVHIYVPRTRTLANGPMTLGSLCIMRCDDSAVYAKAVAVAMGRAPLTGETLVIDRSTILSRLAAEGIKARSVAMSGAPAVSLTCNATTFSSEKILAAAGAYLDAHRPGAAGSGYRLLRKVGRLSVADDGKAKLLIRTHKDVPPGYVKLEAAAIAGKRALGAVEMLFKITYAHRQAVTTQRISAGTVFTPHNTRLRTVNLDGPATPDWSPPYGSEATRNIAPGTVVAANMTRTHKLEIVVRRKQAVTMIVRGPGFMVQGKGEALQDGRPGDMIKVRNNTSKRIVKAKVQYDGTVVPTMESN